MHLTKVTLSLLTTLILPAQSINSDLLTSSNKQLCVECNLYWGNLPLSVSNANVTNVIFAEPMNGGCLDSNLTSPAIVTNADAFTDKAVVFTRGNCTFVAMMDVVYEHGGKAVLVLNHDGSLISPSYPNITDFESEVAFCMIQQKDINAIQENDSIQLYSKPYNKLDPSASVFLVLACGCILIGSYLGTARERYVAFTDAAERRVTRAPATTSAEEEASQELTPRKILIFILFASAFLMLLYFLFKYLVYILIAVFALFGIASLHDLLSEAASHTSLWQSKYQVNIYKFPDTPIVSILILAVSVAIGGVWAIERNSSFAWVLQDILGVSVLTTIIKLVSIPNLKIATILLSLLLVYDVFFVFVTPLFTGKESVMIHAATGGAENAGATDALGCVYPKEMLPFLLRSPRWLTPDCKCPSDSMLGFGDVAFPGWLVGLCMRFDCFRAMSRSDGKGGSGIWNRYRFTIVSIISYAVGLVCAFVAAGLSDMPQPALLYLSPCTLGAVWTMGWMHGDLKSLLNLSVELKKAMDPQSSRNHSAINREIKDDDDDDDDDTNVIHVSDVHEPLLENTA